MIMIRRAQAEDAAGLTQAIEDAYAIYRGRGIALPPVSDAIAKAIAETPVFVADQDGTIVGGVILRLEESAQIENVAVAQDGMGKGVGTSLIARAEKEACERGYASLTLATHEDLTDNLRYYTRLGWTQTGRDGVKVLMNKPLHPD